MVSALHVCRQTCCRPSATSSVRTPTSASTNHAVSSSTPTGLVAVVTQRQRLTMSKSFLGSAALRLARIVFLVSPPLFSSLSFVQSTTPLQNLNDLYGCVNILAHAL